MIRLDPGLWTALILAAIVLCFGVGHLIAWLAEAVARDRRRRHLAAAVADVAERHVNDAVNLACRHCAGQWVYRCTCASKCEQPGCDWEFERDLAALLRAAAAGEHDEPGRPE